jgi:hypothetical protein
MSRNQSLYHKALVEWKGELEKKQQAILEDKRTKLRDGLHQKLTKMVGRSTSSSWRVRTIQMT